VVEKRRSLGPRWSLRQRLDAAVMLYVGARPPWPGRCRDVSIGGLFVETDTSPFTLNAPLAVGFAAVSEDGGIAYARLPARVLRLDPGGLGLMLTDSRPQTLEALRALCFSRGVDPAVLFDPVRSWPPQTAMRL